MTNINLLNYILRQYFGLGDQDGGRRTNKKKWTQLIHNGPLFPPEYIQHNVPVIYQGEPVYLNKEAEEAFTMYAKYLDTDYIKNSRFRSNFWKDVKKILGKDHIIKNLEDCEFRQIYDHIIAEKAKKKDTKLTENGDQPKSIEDKYKTAIVDGKEQPISNFRLENPGIYIGRGNNKKLGCIKKRIYPEDITLNLSKDAPIPELPSYLKGHRWGKIIHDHYVEWLVSWVDSVTGKNKYIFLGAHSDLRMQSDIEKFELARKLKKKYRTIVNQNTENLSSKSRHTRELATALYLIYKLGIRVGNEKGEDDDVVGATTLRVENVELLENHRLKLDFIGKDSIRYVNTIQIDPLAYKNIREFTVSKDSKDSLFENITSSDLNAYLQGFMKKLSAKTFRTMLMSSMLQRDLDKINKKFDTYDGDDKVNILLDEFNKCHIAVAKFANHFKKESKSFNIQIDKINATIAEVKNLLTKARRAKKKNTKRIAKLKERIKILKAKKDLKIQLKNVSLGTSITNYIDSRIIIAFFKRHNMKIEKVFSKTLMEKFKWAFSVEPTFRF